MTELLFDDVIARPSEVIMNSTAAAVVCSAESSADVRALALL
jgi:hypothetical protein